MVEALATSTNQTLDGGRRKRHVTHRDNNKEKRSLIGGSRRAATLVSDVIHELTLTFELSSFTGASTPLTGGSRMLSGKSRGEVVKQEGDFFFN